MSIQRILQEVNSSCRWFLAMWLCLHKDKPDGGRLGYEVMAMASSKRKWSFNPMLNAHPCASQGIRELAFLQHDDCFERVRKKCATHMVKEVLLGAWSACPTISRQTVIWYHTSDGTMVRGRLRGLWSRRHLCWRIQWPQERRRSDSRLSSLKKELSAFRLLQGWGVECTFCGLDLMQKNGLSSNLKTPAGHWEPQAIVL